MPHGVCIIICIHVPTVVCIYCVQYMSTCTPLGVGTDLSCPHSPLTGNNTLYYIIVLLVLGHDESAPTPCGMFVENFVVECEYLTEYSPHYSNLLAALLAAHKQP